MNSIIKNIGLCCFVWMMCYPCFAQYYTNQLFVHNRLDNSFLMVERNKPYQIWLSETNNLKGYFDKVNTEDFDFVTKDSTYNLKAEEIIHVIRISGFSENAQYYQPDYSLKQLLGSFTTAVGGIFFIPFSIAALSVGEALIPAGISAVVSASGIYMIVSSKSSKKKVSNSLANIPKQEYCSLRILKN